ncbi:hypothetical protein CFC21_014229 [Triticum aestivum]|uniref:NB-ARC domain-containing protein n=2 Tax=Triticum aestivum TaxID=4565 RepID=A0A9R1IZ21_WHEAT|nr:hypothetical protein CFC21_014229 [Triticum aestivum]
MELFCRNTFGRGVEKQAELISVAEIIVHKCKGLPLAIKTMATLLCLKHPTQWFSVLDSDVWKDTTTRIAPVLQLSYDHLSSEEKICFSFCAIFPKNTELDKDMLIQLWMVNDLIPSETRGQQVFNMLVWRCFLQDVEIQKCVFSECPLDNHHFISIDTIIHRPTTCKMHDLMHDLADSVSGNDCFILQESSLSQEILQGSTYASSLHHEVRHLSVDYVGDYTIAAMEEILAPQPRTILGRTDTPLSMAKSKFLSLQASRTFPTETNMTYVKHLHYLDCSYSNISALLEATTMLYSLQTLNLTCCLYLEKLPEGMRYMSSLRHIILVACCSLDFMPQGIGQLNSLQTLTSYVVHPSAGRGIDQLKILNLGDCLSLTELRNVFSPEDAKQWNMSAKHNLK